MEPQTSILPAVEARPFSRPWYEVLHRQLGAAGCRQLGFYVLPEDFLLSVVIPVYNEEEMLRELVARVRAVPIRKQIILVDDCSRDRSAEIMRDIEATLGADPENRILTRFHPLNRGKGAALRTGLADATGDVVLVQDADLEYDPQEYPRLLQPLVEGQADVDDQEQGHDDEADLDAGIIPAARVRAWG